jgi:hypothetical protein
MNASEIMKGCLLALRKKELINYALGIILKG